MPATSTIVRARSWSDVLLSLPLSLELVRTFARHDSFAEAWETCERPDYLLRVAGELVKERGSTLHKCVARAAGACASANLDRAPDGDRRPRLALRTLDRWCDGENCLAALRVAWKFAHNSAEDCQRSPAYAAWSALNALEVTAFSSDKAPFHMLGDAASLAAQTAMCGRGESRDILGRQLCHTVRKLVPLSSLGEIGR